MARNPQSSQAFVLDRNLAVQFHPEMNSEILASWIATGRRRRDRSIRHGRLDQLVRQTREHDPTETAKEHTAGRCGSSTAT